MLFSPETNIQYAPTYTCTVYVFIHWHSSQETLKKWGKIDGNDDDDGWRKIRSERETPLELIPPPCPIFPCLHTPLHLPPSRLLESFSLPSMLVKLYYKVNHTSLKH
jgi:hypothetical protein